MSNEALLPILALLALIAIGVFCALKPRFSGSRKVSDEPHQPVPDVTPDDLERIVRRDFPCIIFEDVMSILKGYASQWKGSSTRVQLAALKLADGDVDSLRRHVAAATQDYRDVLVAAEYPQYWKATSRSRRLSKREYQQVVEADWIQYESWLRR